MVKKRKKKNAITLLALVITIVIMLLLAGVAIQMTMGENGLIAKSLQAQKEQAKAELYDTAKLSYTSLNAKALENGQPSPQAELALSTTEFRARYDIVGDDITDKKGNVIDTKLNVLNVISGLKGASEDTEISMKGEYVEKPWPKKVAGVTIPEEDKDKMILKVKVLRKTEIEYAITCGGNETVTPEKIVNIDFGNGVSRDITDYKYGRESMEYEPGEYIVKIKNFSNFSVDGIESEIEVLQWGNITEEGNEGNSVSIPAVSKIYEPEPDRIPIEYNGAKFTEIPEWLFSKKVTSKRMSEFYYCTGLTSIPENLFKNCVNARNFELTFKYCKGLTSIPENLFKNNINVTYFSRTFYGCEGLTSIPENLFKYNVNVEHFYNIFEDCTGLKSIPENLFKYNVNVTDFYDIFAGCIGLRNIPEELFKNNVKVTVFGNIFKGCTSITTIPEGLFRYNTNVEEFGVRGYEIERDRGIFAGCTALTSIPENLFKYNVNARDFCYIFKDCTGLTSIPENLFRYNINAFSFKSIFYGCKGLTSIPENLFKHNVKSKEFEGAFFQCESITSIPEDLFKNNVNAEEFNDTFRKCTGLTTIPEKIIEFAKKVKENRRIY